MRGIGVAVITSRCGGRSAFCGQHHPLGDAEAVLLVDHGEAEPLVGDRLLEDGVGADEHVDRAVGEAHQGRFARPALLAAGEDGDVDRQAGELARQRVEMLAGEDLGRREQRRLGAGLDRGQHRHQRDQGLARADVALEQAQHRRLLLQVALDLGDRAALGAGRRVGQLERVAQPAVALRAARPRRRCDEARTSIRASWLANTSS